MKYQILIKKPRWLRLPKPTKLAVEIVKENHSTVEVFIPKLGHNLTIKRHRLIVEKE